MTDRSDWNVFVLNTIAKNFANGYVYSSHVSNTVARIVFDVLAKVSKHVVVAECLSREKSRVDANHSGSTRKNLPYSERSATERCEEVHISDESVDHSDPSVLVCCSTDKYHGTG